jgi:cytochrome d ubiquinol oxidase subunit I
VCDPNTTCATEVGRQPWVVYGYLRTPDAAGDNPQIWILLVATAVLYTGLTIGAVVVLRSMARRWRAGEEDLPSPYGPGTGPVPEYAPGGPAAPGSGAR